MTEPGEIEASRVVNRPMRDALRRGRLRRRARRDPHRHPPRSSAEIRAAELHRSRLEAQREDLAKGTGRYRDHPVAQALRELSAAENNVARLERNLRGSGRSRKDKRVWRAELQEWRPQLAAAARDVANLTAPEVARLDTDEQRLRKRLDSLWRQRESYQSWASRYPEAEGRLDQLAAEVTSIDDSLDRKPPGRDLPPSLHPDRWAHLTRGQDRPVGLDLGRYVNLLCSRPTVTRFSKACNGPEALWGGQTPDFAGYVRPNERLG
ncbi:MAG: hypothetical protein ACRD07_15830 [Acidimicrobiales bacterium]